MDDPPHIGLFVEIEGPNEATISTMARRLGVADAYHQKASYVRMLCAFCDANHIADRIVRLASTSAS